MFLKKLLCGLLTAVMILGAVPVSAMAEPAEASLSAGEELPADVKAALDIVTRDISEFSSVIDMSKLTQIIQRFGGIGSFASGCVAIMEALGIVQDARMKEMATILEEVQDIKGKLEQMDQKLDDIAVALINIAIHDEEIARETKARDLLSYWRKFNTDYVEKMAGHVEMYQSKVKAGISSWWAEQTHEGVWIVYTDLNGENSLTFSQKSYEEGLPEIADNGESILPSVSIGLPSEYMPKTSEESFDIDAYKDRLKTLTSASVISAADAGKLSASEDFYNKWKQFTDEEKMTAADAYAEDFVNTVIYRSACKQLTQEDGWVSQVIIDYHNFCSNILQTDSGIDALINAQYLTHGLEGEVKKSITDICDSMAATAGYYGLFALAVAGQDALQSKEDKAKLKQLWADTVNSIDKKKSDSLTGKDNYCYIVGGCISFEALNASTSMQVVSGNAYASGGIHSALHSFSADPWEVKKQDGTDADLSNILNDVYGMVLYHQYLCQKPKDQEQSYPEFLKANGVNIPADFSGQLITTYKGTPSFPLADGLPMTAHNLFGSYFKSDREYRINTGNSSSVSSSRFVVHDSLLYNCLDLSEGSILYDQVGPSRALYAEGHNYWWTDEGHMFVGNADMQIDRVSKKSQNPWAGQYYKITDTASIQAPVYTISYSKVAAAELPEDSPLMAFDCCHRMNVAEPDPVEPPESKADWEQADVSVLDLYAEDDPYLEEGIALEIERAVSLAKEEGIQVNLTDAQKSRIAEQMKQTTLSCQEELKANRSLKYLNALGLEGNDETELQLASRVLPGTYLNSDGMSRISAENINTMAVYEPFSMLHFVEKDGRAEPVINKAFDIKPLLVIWDSAQNCFVSFEVSNDVMTDLGLCMEARVPAASAGKQQSITVRHYDNFAENYVLLEEQTIPVTGEDADRYAVMKVAQCSPFELVSAEQSKPVSPVKTGDSSQPGFWIFLSVLSLLSIGALILFRIRKRERN